MATTTTFGELTGDYVLDPVRTRIGFAARHTLATGVRGEFGEFEGSARLDGDDPSRSGVRLTIGATSIRTRNRQRDDLLRGKFLDVANHPVLTFASASVEQVGEAVFRVTGDLTMRDVSHPVTLDMALTGTERGRHGEFRVGFTGLATINRKDWGVNWNVMTTLMVAPKVAVQFDVSAIRT